MSEESKDRLSNLILDKIVGIRSTGKDNFGRTLAYVFLDTLLVNDLLVEEGLATFIMGKTQTEYSLQLEQSQEKARRSERGIFSSVCETKKQNCFIKGNYRSADNTRIYHTPDCYNYEKITIKPNTTDRWFCTEDEAKKAGFRKSLDCPK